MLEVAMAIIEEHGEVGMRVRDVAMQTGVSYASLYHFFGSREGLVLKAQIERYERELRWVSEELATRVAPCTTKDELGRAIADMLHESYNPERSGYRLTRVNVLGSCQGRPELAAEVAAAQTRANRAIAEALHDPQQRGWIPVDLDLEMFAMWFYGQLNGRVLVELDPSGARGDEWDRIAVRATVAVVLGLTDPTHA
jgi:AcrR family transcriptional regulator